MLHVLTCHCMHAHLRLLLYTLDTAAFMWLVLLALHTLPASQHQIYAWQGDLTYAPTDSMVTATNAAGHGGA